MLAKIRILLRLKMKDRKLEKSAVPPRQSTATVFSAIPGSGRSISNPNNTSSNYEGLATLKVIAKKGLQQLGSLGQHYNRHLTRINTAVTFNDYMNSSKHESNSTQSRIGCAALATGTNLAVQAGSRGLLTVGVGLLTAPTGPGTIVVDSIVQVAATPLINRTAASAGSTVQSACHTTISNLRRLNGR